MSHHVSGMQSQLAENVYYPRSTEDSGTPGMVDGNDLNLMHQFTPASDEHTPMSANAVPTAVPGVVVPSAATTSTSAPTVPSEPKKKRQPGTKICPSCNSTIAAALAKCNKCTHVFREKKEKIKRSGKRGKKVCPTCSHENPSACSQCQNCKHIFRLKMIEKYRRNNAAHMALHTPQAQAQAAQQLHSQHLQQQQQQQAPGAREQQQQSPGSQQPRTSGQGEETPERDSMQKNAQARQQPMQQQVQQQQQQAQQQQMQRAQMQQQMLPQQRQQFQHQAMHHQMPNVSAHMTASGLSPISSTSHMIAPQHFAQHPMAQQTMQGQYIPPHMQHMAPHPGLHHMAPHLQPQQQQHLAMQQQVSNPLHSAGQVNSQLHSNQDF